MNRSMLWRQMIVGLFTLFFILPSFAQIEEKQFDTSKQNALYKELIAEFRCLVCQNQNLVGSDAPLAQDIRHKIHQMIIEKKTKRDIVDYMVARYGEFVLYKPRLTIKTFLLWFAPFLVLLFLFFWLRSQYKKKPTTLNHSNLDLEEINRAKELLRK